MRFDFQCENLCFNPLRINAKIADDTTASMWSAYAWILKLIFNFILCISRVNPARVKINFCMPRIHDQTIAHKTKNLSHLIHTPHTPKHFKNRDNDFPWNFTSELCAWNSQQPRVKCKPHFMERFIKTLLSSNYFHWFFLVYMLSEAFLNSIVDAISDFPPSSPFFWLFIYFTSIVSSLPALTLTIFMQ